MKKFSDLSPIEKKKLLVKWLGIKVDELFLEEVVQKKKRWGITTTTIEPMYVTYLGMSTSLLEYF